MLQNEKTVVEIVSEMCQVDDIFHKCRKRDNVLARQFAWKIMRDYFGYTLKRIADIFGKDHSTIVNGLETINNLIAVNDTVTMMRWQDIMGDERMTCILEDTDKVVTMLVPGYVDKSELVDHIKAAYPKIEIH